MSGGAFRRKVKRKISGDSDDVQSSFCNVANTYGVRYGPNVSNNSRCRLSRSATRGVPSTNATVNVTRLGFSLRLSSGICQNDENLEGLLHQKWNIYSASAFNYFDSSSEILDSYSHRLDKIMSVKLQKPKRSEVYSSNFKFSPGHPSVLTLEVFSFFDTKYDTRSRNKSSDALKNLVYVGQFFSWDEKKVLVDAVDMSENSSAFYMPLLLCRSSTGAAFIDSVNNCLKALFDIHISKTYLSQEDMSWLANLASSDLDESSISSSVSPQVHFFYDSPRVSLLDCQPDIAISYEVKLIDQLWKCVHQEGGAESEITYDEVSRFMRCMEEHCLCAYKINLTECCVVKFVIPSASVSINGMIKLTSLMVAGRMLRFLADKCALGSSLVPSLGFSVTLRYN